MAAPMAFAAWALAQETLEDWIHAARREMITRSRRLMAQVILPFVFIDMSFTPCL